MDSVAIWDSSSESDDDETINVSLQRRVIREKSDIMSLPNKMWDC